MERLDNSELKAEARNARRRSQLTAVRSGVAKLDTACIKSGGAGWNLALFRDNFPTMSGSLRNLSR
jgi:hypothetical protein